MARTFPHTPVQAQPEPLIAWPGRTNLQETLPLCLLFMFTFYALYGGTAALTGLHSWRLPLYFQFELAIPFWPQWAGVYLSLDLLLGLAPFIFRSLRQLLPLFVTLVGETVAAVPFFLLLPIQAGFPSHPAAGFLFNLADTTNLEHNYLPSLHVAFAFTTALAFSRLCRWPGRCFFLGWALAIAASTLLIHEHHLLDLLAGGLLAWVAMSWLYPRVETFFMNYPQLKELRLARLGEEL
jgi:membrane-associated phospholipid phosphatase